MRALSLLVLPAALLAGACTLRPAETVSPPPGNAGLPLTTSPTRSAILSTAYGFARTDRVHGQPDRAARLVAQLEFLAAALQTEFREFSPLVPLRMQQARAEVRRALGVSPDAPAQAAVNAFDAAATAFAAGNPAAAEAALAPVTAPGGNPAVALAALPQLPMAAAATAQAERELFDPPRLFFGAGLAPRVR